MSTTLRVSLINEMWKYQGQVSDTGLPDAVRDLQKKRLKEVEATLDQLSKGKYGICMDCGGEIGEARLKAEPAAQRCIKCQSTHELKGGEKSRNFPKKGFRAFYRF